MKKLSLFAKNLNPMVKTLSPFSRVKWGTIFFTRQCNLGCPYCAVSNHQVEDIPFSEWTRIVDKLSTFGVSLINIVGGEPTLRKDVHDLVTYIRQSGILPVLHSNFTRMSQEQIDLFVKDGLFCLQGSVDSFNGFGKSNIYEKTLDLLEYAAGKGIVSTVSTVATAINASEIPRMARIITAKGLFYTCGLYQDIGGDFSVDNKRLLPSPETMFEIFSYLKTLKRMTGLIRNTYCFLDNLHYYYSRTWKCNPRIDNWVIINSNGTLMPCEEYSSDIHVLDVSSLSDSIWRKYKIEISNRCKGCYHHCYFEAENVKRIRLLKEFWALTKCAIT
jgi:MoaA/NifB/PqqE/SkfB family radical SAM enzyme